MVVQAAGFEFCRLLPGHSQLASLVRVLLNANADRRYKEVARRFKHSYTGGMQMLGAFSALLLGYCSLFRSLTWYPGEIARLDCCDYFVAGVLNWFAQVRWSFTDMCEHDM